MCLILSWLGLAQPGVIDRVEGPGAPGPRIAVVEWSDPPPAGQGWWFEAIPDPAARFSEGQRLCRVGALLLADGAIPTLIAGAP